MAEIERHFHSNERWYGLAVTPNGELHRADRVGSGVNPFVMDAGDSSWGSWLQVVGSDDTPEEAGNVYLDFHRILITDTERTTVHFIQVSFGDTGAAGLTAGTYSEAVVSPASATADTIPLAIHTRRMAVGEKVWIRVLVLGANTGTVDFYYGFHEYEG